MHETPPQPSDFLPLSVLSFHVLLALGGRPAHGYAIGKEIERRSNGRLKPTTGGLYQALKRLGDGGLIERAPDAEADSEDARRQYFRLTPLGRRVAEAEARRMDELIRVASDRKLYGRSS